MPVIQLKAEVSFDQLANAANQLSAAELQRLLSQLAVRPLYEEHRLSDAESELLMKISQGVPRSVQQRYSELTAKRDERTLTDEEYNELLQLTDQVELLDAERLKYLTELAGIQNKPLLLLMDELKIKPGTVCVKHG
jgi:hypothetical protein